jgi:hypothetical protein
MSIWTALPISAVVSEALKAAASPTIRLASASQQASGTRRRRHAGAQWANIWVIRAFVPSGDAAS